MELRVKSIKIQEGKKVPLLQRIQLLQKTI